MEKKGHFRRRRRGTAQIAPLAYPAHEPACGHTSNGGIVNELADSGRAIPVPLALGTPRATGPYSGHVALVDD